MPRRSEERKLSTAAPMTVVVGFALPACSRPLIGRPYLHISMQYINAFSCLYKGETIDDDLHGGGRSSAILTLRKAA